MKKGGEVENRSDNEINVFFWIFFLMYFMNNLFINDNDIFSG